MTPTLAERLQASPLFVGLTPDDIQALIAVMEQRTYQTNEVLFNKDTLGDEMYVITTGRIRIYTFDDHGNELTIRHYDAPEVVGELSPLDRQPRSATAAAAETSQVLVLNRSQLLRFIQDRPSVGLAMMRGLASRVRYTSNYLTKVMEWLQHVSDDDFDLNANPANSDEDIEALISSFYQTIIYQNRKP